MLAVLFLLFGTSACRQQTPQYSEVIAIFTPASVAKQIPKAPQRQAPVETPAETQAAASFVGCYKLKVGRWWPWGFGEDNGFTGVSLELQKHGDELRGRAHPHFDAVPLIPRTANVTAKRIACDASIRP